MNYDKFIDDDDEDNIDTYDSDKDAEYKLPGVSNGKLYIIIYVTTHIIIIKI